MSGTHADPYMTGKRGALLGIFSNLVLFALKFFAAMAGRSHALLADAFHTASDMATSTAVLVGFKIAERPADEHHPFGHGRAESIAAKIVSILLIFAGFGIAYSSARALLSGEVAEPGAIALWAAVVSILVKEVSYRVVDKMSHRIKSKSLHTDALHHRSDALSSFAALIGIAGARMGHAFLDPLAGIIVAAFIIKMGFGAFHEAYDELMDAAPSPGFRNKIASVIGEVAGVGRIKGIMVRKLGIEHSFEITIGVDGSMTVEEGHMITISIKKALRDKIPSAKRIVVHVEPVEDVEGDN